MVRDLIFRKVRNSIAEIINIPDKFDIKETSSLESDLHMDDFDIARLFTEIEDIFLIDTSAEEYDDLASNPSKTVNDIVTLVEEKLV